MFGFKTRSRVKELEDKVKYLKQRLDTQREQSVSDNNNFYTLMRHLGLTITKHSSYKTVDKVKNSQ